VGGHAHQCPQPPRWQLGVGIQGQQVAGVRGQLRVGPQVEKGAGGAGGQGGQQLLQLAALALPAYPALLGGAVAACAVQQDEAVGLARCGRVALVELGQCVAGGLQQGGIAGQAGLVGIGPVGQQGKLGVGLLVGQVLIRPCEVSSGILDVMILEVSHDALGGFSQRGHEVVGSLT